MFIVLSSLCVTLFLYLIWRNYYRVVKYWEFQGIPQPKGGNYPIFGHMWPIALQRISEADHILKFYKEFEGCSMVGLNNSGVPALLIRDPELLKRVLVTDFTSFSHNSYHLDPKRDPLIWRHPAFSNDDVWMYSRKRLVQLFAGKHRKILCEHVRQVCFKLREYLHRQLEGKDKAELELIEFSRRYTAELAASATFSVEGFSFDDGHHPDSLYHMCRTMCEREAILSEPSFLMFPTIPYLLQQSYLPRQVNRYIMHIATKLLEERKNVPKGEERDVFQMMIQYDKDRGDEPTIENLATYSFIFMSDILDTTSATLKFVLYELAKHPDIQEKVRQEVRSVLARFPNDKNIISYEAAKNLPYLERVLLESMRVHCLGDYKIRRCTKRCKMTGSDGLTCYLEPGMQIFVSNPGLFNDTRYWDKPEIFDPDRFMPEREKERPKHVYMPFSEGPRQCIGMKLGRYNMQAAIATILNEFSMEISPRTSHSFRISPKYSLATPDSGMWVYFKRL